MKGLLTGMLTLALLVAAGCSQPGAPAGLSKTGPGTPAGLSTTGPGTPAGLSTTGPGTPCPYAGAVVDATYPKEFDLAKIRDVLVSLGWEQSNTGVHEVINGTLDGASVGSVVASGETLLGVHVLQSQNEADYQQEDKAAEAILRRITGRVEEALGLPPPDHVVHRINLGCEG